MKIFLRHGSHPVYQDLVNFLPRGVDYILPEGRKFVVKPSLQNRLKIFLWSQYTRLRPPAIFVEAKNADLIHSNLMILNKRPWIIDIESVGNLVNFRYEKIFQKSYTRQIDKILSSEFCKKIIAHTKAGFKSLVLNLKPIHFRDKMEIVYPAVRVTKFKKKKNNPITFLFIGRRFYQKGGKEVLQTFKLINQKFDVKLLMLSDVPESLRGKFTENVTYISPAMPREEVYRKIYPQSDIFLFPSYIDTIPTVVLEAMGFRLPVITTDVFSMPELIENERGFVINSDVNYYDKKFLFKFKHESEINYMVQTSNLTKIVNQLFEKCKLLIEDSSLRKRIGREARDEIVKGKFSIPFRNKQLKRIYEETLRR